MSEAGDYTPRIWKDHDFGSARAAYDRHVGRSYDDAKKSGKTAKDVLPKSLSTTSRAPLIIVCDETGSMGEWPTTIFSKLPYLYNEAHDAYLGPDVEISFGAFGDATCGEEYAVQARPFADKDDVKKRLTELIIEGGGGGQIMESSELVALYYARNCECPNAEKPIYIFITDEYCWDPISEDRAEQMGVSIRGSITAKEVFAELNRKFSVYLIQKPYGDETSEKGHTTSQVRKKWLQHFDESHIALLADPTRVVDVIFGILAAESGKLAYFKKELEERQLKDADGAAKVDAVYKALHTIHTLAAPEAAKKLLKSGNSTLFRAKGAGKKSKDLG